MLADALNKAEFSKGNDVMTSVLRNGTYRLARDAQDMQLRKNDPHRKQRYRRTSAALMGAVRGYDDDGPEVEQGLPPP